MNISVFLFLDANTFKKEALAHLGRCTRYFLSSYLQNKTYNRVTTGLTVYISHFTHLEQPPDDDEVEEQNHDADTLNGLVDDPHPKEPDKPLQFDPVRDDLEENLAKSHLTIQTPIRKMCDPIVCH